MLGKLQLLSVFLLRKADIGRVNWVSFAMFAMPVRSQLASLIFAKLLKAKCGVDQTALPSKVQRQDAAPNGVDIEEGREADETDSLLGKEEDADTGEDKAANGAVNLLAIDVQRISEFVGYNVDLLRGLVKIVLSSIFLVFILGWQRYVNKSSAVYNNH